jgi:oligopeptide/dipeptide ABC transporter ATP-binding protein
MPNPLRSVVSELAPENSTLLTVRDLIVEFQSAAGPVRAVDGVSFDVRRGRTTAIVGESGCGKSATAMSILRLLPTSARTPAGAVELAGLNLLTATDAEIRAVRGRRIGMVFQEPATALNPVMTIGDQISDVLRHHLGLSRRDAARRAVTCLEDVAMPDPARIATTYPHQLSGGMRQRAMIAIALAGRPDMIIADEPTTALDVTVQNQILTLLATRARERGMATLLITHDLGVVSAVADDVVVMYAGRVVERGPVADVLASPLHPYTEALLMCVPRMPTEPDVAARADAANAAAEPAGAAAAVPQDGGAAAKRPVLHVVPGAVPDPRNVPPGCRFEPRCAVGQGDRRCHSEDQELVSITPDRAVACWKSVGNQPR